MKSKIEEIEKFIIKHDDIFLVMIFFLIIIGNILLVETTVEDELWNFQNIYKIFNGNKIYTEANVITTPLFHFIGVIIFKILGANFFVFRMYNCAIFVYLYLGIYKIFKALKIQKENAFLLTLIIFSINRRTLLISPTYNTLSIMFVIYALLIFICKNELKYYILHESIFITMIILTKQNIGILYILGMSIFYVLFDRKNFKEFFKIISLIMIYLCVFLFIFFKINILNDFINLCFLGIKEFATRNYTVQLNYLFLLFLIPLINIVLMICLNFFGEKNEKESLCKIACFAYPILIMNYPMFNVQHITVSLFLQYIMFIYLLYILFCNTIFKYKKILIICMICFFSIKSIIFTDIYFNIIKMKKIEYNNPFFGSLFEENIEYKIEKVTNYIKSLNEKVVILSPDAALYMIPLKQNNSEFDLLLLGNMGIDGENKVMEKIANFKKEIILINKKEISYQESKKIRKYVEDNFKNIGEIEDLLIYQKASE